MNTNNMRFLAGLLFFALVPITVLACAAEPDDFRPAAGKPAELSLADTTLITSLGPRGRYKMYRVVDEPESGVTIYCYVTVSPWGGEAPSTACVRR